MYVIGALFFWFLGITMLLKPDLVYQIRESWKHSTGTEPSERYIRTTRWSGVMFLLAGVLCVVVIFLP